MADRLDLVRDLLDTKVVDRDGREMGRVDGVVLEIGGGGAPRVAAIEIGAEVLFRRVRPFFGRWAAGVERALGIERGRPMRIPSYGGGRMGEQRTSDDERYGESARLCSALHRCLV